MNDHWNIIHLTLLFIASIAAQSYDGDSCTFNGSPGVCKNIKFCPPVIEGLKNRVRPQQCSFDATGWIICCPVTATPEPAPMIPPRSPSPPQTTERYEPPPADYVYETDEDSCPPIPSNMTRPKTGRKAFDKCIEYQELVYPCERPPSLSESALVRGSHCKHNAIDLVVGGIDAKKDEFPHMVMLGYGGEISTDKWLCGGTLISNWFVLTAGHCIYHRDYREVTYIRQGALRRSEPLDRKRIYRVGQIIKHPQYAPPQKYNDIALLKAATEMKLDQFAVPACLPVSDAAKPNAWVTGWGATQYKGANADVLQKVSLQLFSPEACSKTFPPERLLAEGLKPITQVCYGHKTESKDTCQGDSGGPLQVANSEIHCMYTVIGITSYGKACGFVGTPGVYTRVSTFTPWIETVVWP